MQGIVSSLLGDIYGGEGEDLDAQFDSEAKTGVQQQPQGLH